MKKILATLSLSLISSAIFAQTTSNMTTPTDAAASGRQVPREIFAQIPAKDNKLEWLGKRNQMQFYEDPITIDLSVNQINHFFTR